MSEQTGFDYKEYNTWFDALNELFTNDIWKDLVNRGWKIVIEQSPLKNDKFVIVANQDATGTVEEMVNNMKNLVKDTIKREQNRTVYKHVPDSDEFKEGIQP